VRRRLVQFALPAMLVLAAAGTATAQDFGILESAETINQGNFKIRANPIVLFGRDGGDSEFGVVGVLGYGFTRRFDVEGGVAIYDGVTFFGANAEYWLVKENPIDFSIAGGLHRRTGDQTLDFTGVDLTFLASGHVAPRLEIYGGLDLAFEGIGVPGDFKTAHLVPGIEYKVNEKIDVVAEAGLALNDNGRHYIAGGLAIYFR
jgi:uncharacterized protein YneR